MPESNTFPEEGMELTTILVVEDIQRSREFYENVLNAEIFREYGGTSLVLKFLGNWLLLVTEGGPTDDKPNVSFIPPVDVRKVSQSFTIRVKDCHKSYEVLKERGVEFLTPPVDWDAEIRAFFRDPDGHLFEISQA